MILALIYIMVKPYPMDYVDGVLLVDPQAMMNDTFKACGGFLGFIIGAFIDRKYIHYEIPVGTANLPILTAVGAFIMFSWKTWFAGATIVALFGKHWGNLLAMLIMVVFGMGVWPVVIRKATKD